MRDGLVVLTSEEIRWSSYDTGVFQPVYGYRVKRQTDFRFQTKIELVSLH